MNMKEASAMTEASGLSTSRMATIGFPERAGDRSGSLRRTSRCAGPNGRDKWR